MFKILSVKSSHCPLTFSDEEIDEAMTTVFLCKTQKEEKKLISENINDTCNDNSNISYTNGVNNVVRIFEAGCREHNKNCLRTYADENRVNIGKQSGNRKTTKTTLCSKPIVKNNVSKKKRRIK